MVIGGMENYSHQFLIERTCVIIVHRYYFSMFSGIIFLWFRLHAVVALKWLCSISFSLFHSVRYFYQHIAWYGNSRLRSLPFTGLSLLFHKMSSPSLFYILFVTSMLFQRLYLISAWSREYYLPSSIKQIMIGSGRRGIPYPFLCLYHYKNMIILLMNTSRSIDAISVLLHISFSPFHYQAHQYSLLQNYGISISKCYFARAAMTCIFLWYQAEDDCAC